VECFSPRRLSDSSAGSELIMSTRAAKSIIAFRICFGSSDFGGRLLPHSRWTRRPSPRVCKWSASRGSSVSKRLASR
jgi:hypothetical protein